MNKTVDDYSQSLVDLERQKKQLEQMMKKMGEEWEESGAGIGWLNSIQSSTCSSSSLSSKPKINIDHDYLNQKQLDKENHEGEEEEEEDFMNDDLMSLTSPLTPEENKNLYSFFNQHHSPNYLDSLLTMNESLLAQSDHTNTTFSSSNIPTIDTTNVSSPTSMVMTPPITPDEKENKKNHTPLYFHSK
ncbi:unnamed protein product [Cunninghamella blakesleeana]